MRRLLLAALLLPLSGCASDAPAAPAVAAPEAAVPLEAWNFTASQVLLLDGMGACKVLAFQVPPGTSSLGLYVDDPMVTAHGLNNVDGAGRVRIEAFAPDGSKVPLAEQTVPTNPFPYGWAAQVDSPAAGDWSVRVEADPAAVAHRILVEWSEEGLGPEPSSQQQSARDAPC